MPQSELQYSEAVALTTSKQLNEKSGRLACLPIGAQESILEFLSPNYAFALLPLPGAIYRLFYHPQTTSRLQILLLKVSQQFMEVSFWTLFNNPAIPNATKLMMAAQYSQSIGLVPNQYSLYFFAQSNTVISRKDRQLIAELVWSYRSDELSLVKRSIHDVYNDVINLLVKVVSSYSHFDALDIDFLARHWHQLSEEQQSNLTNLLQNHISRITPDSFLILPLVRQLHLNASQHATIREEMTRIFVNGGHGYEFLNYFFILPTYEQDVLIRCLEQQRNPGEYLEHLYHKCQDSTLKQKLFIACYEYADRQLDKRYLHACVAAMRTCKVIDYFDYWQISHSGRLLCTFDNLDLLLDSAAKNIFSYQDIDSYVTNLYEYDDLSMLIDKIMNVQHETYSIALSVAVYKQANQARILENDDGFLVNIIEHIKFQNFAIEDPNVYAVVDLINHGALSTQQNQQVINALLQNLQRRAYPYSGDDNAQAIAQIVQLVARSNGDPAVQNMLLDCVANHSALNLLIWHGNTNLSSYDLINDIFATLKCTLRFKGHNSESRRHLDNLKEILDALQQSNYAEHKRPITVKEVRQKFEMLVHCLCKNDTWFSLYRYNAQTKAAHEFNLYLRTSEAYKLNQLLSIVYDRTLTTEQEISQFFKDIYEKRVRKRERTEVNDKVIDCDEHSYTVTF